MSALHLVSLAVLGVATLWSLLLLVRSGEPRLALLTVLFALLVVVEAVALESHWGAPLAANAATAGALGALLASVLGLLVLGALADMAVERDRVEALHWDSMQAVRALAEIGSDDRLDLSQRLSALLEMGRASFGLQVGVLCRVKDEQTQVMAISSADAFPVAAGTAFPLEGSYCKDAIASDRPVALARINGAVRADHPAASAFGFQAYLATAVRVHGDLYGTLGFGGLEPRPERFSATEKDLLSLMGQWVASEIELRGNDRDETPAAPDRSGAPWRRHAPAPRGADLNATLRRIEPKLRRMAGSRVQIELSLAADLEKAQAQGVPLEKLIRSLVGNALDAMPEGGNLELRTANLEITAQPGCEMRAAAPNRYVTLSVRDTGNGIDADSLARVFEPADDGSTGTTNGAGDERLHLSTIYRILQRAGGDLSVSVEPGRGTTFTVFLGLLGAPRPAASAASAERAPAPAPARAPAAAPVPTAIPSANA